LPVVGAQSYCYTVPKKKAKLPLSKTHPKLAKEADGWDPSVVTAGSGKKLKWKCSGGHKFEATIGNRTRVNGGNCPVCGGKKVLVGFNDLKTLRPQIANQAYKWDPQTVTLGSGKKYEWICKKKHIWSASTVTRVKGFGCPYCSGLFVIPGKTDLASSHPTIAKLAFGWDPKTIKAGSNKKLQWICSKKHIWSAPVASIAITGNGCPYCSGHQVLAGFNDLKSTHPKLAKELVSDDPTKISKGSDKKLTWKCKYNHKYLAAVSARTGNSSTGCPYCSGNKVLKGFNDLKYKNPKLAKEAEGWDPTQYTTGSNRKKMLWKCKKGHTWSATIASRNKMGVGCPKCSGRDVITGINDLQTLFPKLAKEADGWDPSQVMAGSGKKLGWKCNNGHKWLAKVGSRSFQNNNCPYCSNKITGKGINDLATTHPELAKQAHKWDPTSLSAGSNKSVEWICSQKHTWKTSVAHRSKENTGCPYCFGRQAWPGFNDLNTTNPSLSKEAYGWNPAKYTNSSGAKVKWKCKEGHIWTAAIYSRSEGNKTGCPSCSISGFDPNEKGYIYFLSHSKWEMFQIGITNKPEKRLASHKKLGWEVIENRGPIDGHLTQQWETAILRMLKAKGTDLSNSKIAGKFDGYSEAWSKSTFPVKSIKELMKLTEEFEEGK
jgi:plastocyanin